jgi:drug/metabolite transporter (DMT)-like permease
VSGVSCAFYIICLGRSGLNRLHYLTVTFYLVLLQSIVSFFYGLFSGQLTFSLAPAAWGLAVIIGVLVSICAVTFFQLGVMNAGPPTASMISTVEPITSIAFGAIILSEELTLFKVAGGVLIVSSVGVISFLERKG